MRPPSPPRLSGRNLDAVSGAQRRRLIEAVGRERRAAEAREVGEGVDETVALGEARGGAFTRAATGVVRRQTGLGWLSLKGTIGINQARAGYAYGLDYRTVMTDPGALRSNLGDHTPGGGILDIGKLVAAANRRTAAAARMFEAAERLHHQHDLIHALNVICGQEQTPREAGGNALGAAVLTTRVVIALDLLVAAATPTEKAA